VFAEFNLHERLLKALTELNFTQPTAVQVKAIPVAMQGRDMQVTAQTGTGKTAAFLLPVLHRLLDDVKPGTRTRVLILLPTRELAMQTLQQVESFARYTFLKACLITGGEDFKVQAARMRKIPDILIATPGRMIEHLEASTLEIAQVEVLVLDEADRMLDMGFAEDVERLAKGCATRSQTLLFSATQGSAGLKAMREKVLTDPVQLRLNPVHELNEGTKQQVITADHSGHKVDIML
jgi:superfamily II DNA/RNA helicase